MSNTVKTILSRFICEWLSNYSCQSDSLNNLQINNTYELTLDALNGCREHLNITHINKISDIVNDEGVVVTKHNLPFVRCKVLLKPSTNNENTITPDEAVDIIQSSINKLLASGEYDDKVIKRSYYEGIPVLVVDVVFVRRKHLYIDLLIVGNDAARDYVLEKHLIRKEKSNIIDKGDKLF